MSQYDLTDFERRVIKPLLPNKRRGVPRVIDRRVLNGIFGVARSGAPWRDLPERYGPRTTCYDRFVLWRRAGIWDRLLDAISAAWRYPDDRQHFHQRAPAGCEAKKGIEIIVSVAPRGGLTAKIHAVVDRQGLPLRLSLTAGQAHNAPAALR